MLLLMCLLLYITIYRCCKLYHCVIKAYIARNLKANYSIFFEFIIDKTDTEHLAVFA